MRHWMCIPGVAITLAWASAVFAKPPAPYETREFIVKYEAGAVQPEDYHTYEIHGHFLSKKRLELRYVLNFPLRQDPRLVDVQQASEAKDVTWTAVLTGSWYEDALTLTRETEFADQPIHSLVAPKDTPLRESRLTLTFITYDNHERTGVPKSRSVWESLAAEINAAAHAAQQGQLPLPYRYTVVQSASNSETVVLSYDPLQRSVRMTLLQQNHKVAEQLLPLAVYRKTQHLIERPQYYASGELTTSPTHPGAYLDRGTGTWFTFGDGIQDRLGHPGWARALQNHLTSLLQMATAER